MKIVGIGGTNGSGKDTVGQILEEKHGWKFISLSDVLRDEATARGLTTDRQNLRQVSTELRRQHGTGVMIDRVIEKYNQQGGKYKGLVTSALRNGGEADRVHELGGQVIWVDADPKLRYKRICARSRSDDRVSFEEFMEQEQIEMHQAINQFELKAADVKEKADQVGENDSNYEDLAGKIDPLVKEF